MATDDLKDFFSTHAFIYNLFSYVKSLNSNYLTFERQKGQNPELSVEIPLLRPQLSFFISKIDKAVKPIDKLKQRQFHLIFTFM